MAVMKGKKAMIRNIIRNREVKAKDNEIEIINEVTPQENEERIRILKEQGLLK